MAESESKRQTLSPKEWDYAMENGKNLLALDAAVLYNLVQIRKAMNFFVILAAIGIGLFVIGAVLVIISTTSGDAASNVFQPLP